MRCKVTFYREADPFLTVFFSHSLRVITQKVSKINPSPLVAKFSIIHRRFLHSMRVDRRFVECKKKSRGGKIKRIVGIKSVGNADNRS